MEYVSTSPAVQHTVSGSNGIREEYWLLHKILSWFLNVTWENASTNSQFRGGRVCVCTISAWTVRSVRNKRRIISWHVQLVRSLRCLRFANEIASNTRRYHLHSRSVTITTSSWDLLLFFGVTYSMFNNNLRVEISRIDVENVVMHVVLPTSWSNTCLSHTRICPTTLFTSILKKYSKERHRQFIHVSTLLCHQGHKQEDCRRE
jgi:hypothetical protein